MEFALSKLLEIPDEHLSTVCKYRQDGCCKYIVFFDHGQGFYCVKNVPELREHVDLMNHQMTAKGNNCEGLRDEERSESQRA